MFDDIDNNIKNMKHKYMNGVVGDAECAMRNHLKFILNVLYQNLGGMGFGQSSGLYSRSIPALSHFKSCIGF